MNGFDERFLTRNGLAARELAVLMIGRSAGEGAGRLPRVRDFAERLGVGNGTVQAALRLLEESGAIQTVARGHLGTFLLRTDRGLLWRLSGFGTLRAAMPLPHSRRYEGLATGLRAAFEEAGAPFAITFLRGSAARVAALLEGRADLVVLSRFAADRLMAGQRLQLLADLGPATYVGGHGLLLRRGIPLASPGLRVAVDRSSQDQRALAERVFAGRADVEWVHGSYLRLRELFRSGRADATVWNLDEVQGRLGGVVEVLPLGDAVTRQLSLRNSSAALVGRAGEAEGPGGPGSPGAFGSRALAAVFGALDLASVTALQAQVLRGERVPSY